MLTAQQFNQLIPQFIFMGFAALLVFSSVMVIVSRNPVRAALFLVLAFFAAAGLWILLEVEFLGLILILVYVGAVMTLFLFVVMTLNIDTEILRRGFVRYLPYGVVIVGMLVVLMMYVITPAHFVAGQSAHPTVLGADYSNVKALGDVLYTNYVLPFELAGILLLVSIIAAISLTHRTVKDNKNISADQQINIQPQNRIKIIKMKAEK